MKTVIGDERLRSYHTKLCQDLNEKNNSLPAIARQLDRSEKKMRVADQGLNAKAKQDFLKLNAYVGTINPSIDTYILSNAQLFIHRALETYIRNTTGAIQSTLDMPLVFELWRFGPGTSNGIKGTHFAHKIQQEFSTTEKCLPFAQLMRRLNPHLNLTDEMSGCKFKIMKGSKLGTVPKNRETARTIASEPLCNMAMQLSAGTIIQGALRCVGLDITEQDLKNRDLARIGSIDGSLSTIDMKSCSDLITPKLVELLFGDCDMFHFMMKIRSEYTEVDGEQVKLNMISTMGNGYTFPLMTMIFLALYYGFLCKKNKINSWHIDYTKFGVFGDDIVIETPLFDEFCSVLEEAGFIINHDKSFSEGPFRESCGGDFQAGVEITPFYPKSLLTDSEIYVVINQQLEWGSKHNCWLNNSFEYLLSLLYDPTKPLLVPEWYPPTSGIRTTLCPRRFNALVRKPKYLKAENNSLNYLAVLGGFLIGRRNGDMLYEPRPRRVSYHIERCRLAKGWSTGRDPRYRENEDTRKIDIYISIMCKNVDG